MAEIKILQIIFGLLTGVKLTPHTIFLSHKQILVERHAKLGVQ